MDMETEIRKIAQPCCGSCGYYGYFYENRGCGLLKLREVFAISKPCKFYVPRNPKEIIVVKNEK